MVLRDGNLSFGDPKRQIADREDRRFPGLSDAVKLGAVFSYARRCLTTRPTLWWAALVCATLLALPGSVVALVLVQPATMLVLTGDLGLAFELSPEFMSDLPGALPLAVVASLALVVLYHRFYAVLIWASDEERGPGWGDAWRGTSGRWWRALAINGAFLLGLGSLAAVVGVLTAVALSSSAGAATMAMLTGLTVLLVVRTIGRIHVTLALRAALLEDTSFRASWTRARCIVREDRRQVVAAWSSLLALGAAVWLGGRLVSPILQDTALDFPLMSSYAVAREFAQVAFAIPLEGFILVLSAGIWTAVFRGVESEMEPAPPTPWLPKALAALVVLVVVGNGVPAFVDVRWRTHEDARESRLRAQEIDPDDALQGTASTNSPTVGERTSYRIDAVLEGDRLEWDTRIRYTNTEKRDVASIPLFVYPAAFEGEVEDLPLADDVLSSSIPTGVHDEVETGTFEVENVERIGRGGELRWDLRDTLLDVRLPDALAPGDTIEFRISLAADLPTWPLRYGTWDQVTQLGNWIPTVPVSNDGEWVTHPYGDIGDPFFAPTADYSVTFEAEEDIGFVGTGDLVRVTELPDDRRTWRFDAEGVRDAAFAAGGSLRGLEGEAGGEMVRAWFNGEDTLAGKEVIDDSLSAIASYSSSYGELDHEVDVVSLDSPLGGMEYPGLVFVSAGLGQLEGIPLLPDLVEHSGFEREQTRYVTGHELAHQWWYAAVGNDQVSEPWLDEGFVEASTQLWLAQEDGDDRSSTIAHLQPTPEADAAVIRKGVDDFENNSDYAEAIYDVGGAVLLRLHDQLGRARYEELMSGWYRTNDGGIGTIDEFLEEVEVAGGAEARRLLEGGST